MTRIYRLLPILCFATQIRPIHNFFWKWDCLFGKECITVNVKVYDGKEGETRFDPLYLIGKFHSYTLATPLVVDNDNKDEIKINYSSLKKLIYACPADSPTVNGDNPSTLQRRDTGDLGQGTTIDAYCERKVEATIRNLETTCHKVIEKKNGIEETTTFTLYEVGFEVFMETMLPQALNFNNLKEKLERTWHPLYQVCHHNESRYTLYSKHKLLDVSTKPQSIRCITTFQDHDDEGSIGGASALNKAFKKENVENLFKRFKEGDYLAKGHLIPDGDMSFPPWKCATFRYLNVAPMWQSVNNGIWKKVENAIREASKTLQTPLTIYTGTYGTLYYGKKNHNPMFLTTFKNREIMPIPAYLWKVVHNENTNEGMVFIAANGQYNNQVFDAPCGDDEFCDANDWLLTDIFCCEVSAFAKKVEYAPRLPNVKILKNPSNNAKRSPLYKTMKNTIKSKKRDRASDEEDGERVKRRRKTDT